MGWTEFWARVTRMRERQAEAASEQRWQAAKAGAPGGMRQRGVIH